jgi:hypothetical protein
MATISEMVKRLESLDIESEIPKLIQQTSFEAIALNQIQLYNHGIDKGVVQLSPYKNKYYAKKKNELNPLPGLGVPDLFKTGAYYKSMFLEVTQDTLEVKSNDEKDARLTSLYGDQIKGLTDESKSDYAQNTLKPLLQKYIADTIGVAFG